MENILLKRNKELEEVLNLWDRVLLENDRVIATLKEGTNDTPYRKP